MANRLFENVSQFKYLGTIVTTTKISSRKKLRGD
jgi:hypothetical protein